LLQVSPTIINQIGQFAIRVKNNRKLDAEHLERLEFKVRD
jgi:hypothetical protein